ncbi:MAG: methyl coenzyme M reductase system, component A2 [Candidatus Methanomethyliaceae archaeon]|nr:methyl coenzyme M reductase system, component A2 [Candidatus Methanomethyliaceae archaeon]MDW7970839.1 methyl coenzyme M reductase system, component A2 [Nitrososphaerota archaeon]
MVEPFIIVDNVSKKFDDKYVLKNVSFIINEGDCIGILGKSGSGKSVLISMIKGLSNYEPTSGKIIYRVAYCEKCGFVDRPSKVGGNCLRCGCCLKLIEVDFWNENKIVQDIKRRVAIMFQRTFALYGNLTVYENIMEAFSRRWKINENDITKKALELVEKMGLSHRLIHVARDLSGGEKQRVVLARQLAIDPILLLADEPTGTLDPLSARMIYNMLNELKKENVTMLLTSHLTEGIEILSNKAILLNEGRIEAIGEPKEIVKIFLSEGLEDLREERPLVEDIILKVENVKKYFFSIDRGIVRAIDGVSFEIRRGEIFGIIGVSGAGKTTLSRIIAGLTVPTSGKVLIKVGDEWVNMSEPGITGRGRATSYIGILHQEYSLYPYRTILENLTNAIGLELPDEFAKFKALITLKAVGFEESHIENLFNKYPDELSEGERHRVALSQVLIKEPILVILDEPTGTIDPITQKYIVKSIKSVRRELKQTFIIVSHDIDFIMKTCDEAILLRNGSIVAKGPAIEVVKHLLPEEKAS